MILPVGDCQLPIEESAAIANKSIGNRQSEIGND
jgi:hypothetical protein